MTTPEAHYQVLVFTHANLKRPVHVVAGTISHYLYSETAKATALYTTGGGIIAVQETVEDIDQRLKTLNLKGGN